MRNRLAMIVLLAALSGVTSALSAETPPDAVRAFLGNYCLDCHSADYSEGEREFESLVMPLATEADLITADEIIDQVTLKEMPPQDADQPSDADRVAVVTALRDRIAGARDRFGSTGGRTVMRRLSAREYENTLAALFDRRVDTLGLTADFPKERTSGHMDNIGESLVTSGFLLDQYFAAANRLVETRLGKPAMEPRSWHFTDNFQQYEELSGAHRNFFKYESLALYEQPNTDTRQGGYAHIEDFLEGVPVSGLYEIEANAQAMHRDTHYDPAIFGIDFSEPFQLAVVPGDVRKGHIHYPQAIEPVLDSAIVPDDRVETLRFRVWLEAGQTPRFIFPNGPYESRASVITINKRYKEEFTNRKKANGVVRLHILREGKLPHIRIDDVTIHGPLPEPGGSREEIAVFGEGGFDASRAVEQLREFATRAFRRPLNADDKTRIDRLYQTRIDDQATPRQATLDTVKAILCSPSFLYLSEITPEDEQTLRPHDLASRLSYALWSAPPDEELRAAADDGSLTGDDELERQVRRMLADERSEAFVVGFLDSWLNLRDIGSQPPPRELANLYYAEALPKSMKTEARLFFRHLLDTDGSALDLLDADYTFVDKKLAKLYNLPEKETMRLADGFQRVPLADGSHRGGLLGMAAVLTVSANGVETSPVTRGVWVSENILGVTPPSPPDEVPAIEPDTSGATTIREKLAAHSTDETCAVCHRKIDPYGFPLEAFDPIGRHRAKYPKNKKGDRLPIDQSGTLPSGETFERAEDFKALLKTTRSERFVRHLVDSLLTYATGRHMERVDRYEIEDIVSRTASEDHGLRTMIVDVLTSEIFRSR